MKHSTSNPLTVREYIWVNYPQKQAKKAKYRCLLPIGVVSAADPRFGGDFSTAKVEPQLEHESGSLVKAHDCVKSVTLFLK